MARRISACMLAASHEEYDNLFGDILYSNNTVMLMYDQIYFRRFFWTPCFG
jgi:hypothetical protein